MSQFKNMFFKINGPAHSAAVQWHLFSLGYKWGVAGKAVSYTEYTALFTRTCGTLTYGTPSDASDHEEHVVKSKTVYELVQVPPPRAVVQIDGKTYYADDVAARLAELPEVKQ